jgi:hypothetical protein
MIDNQFRDLRWYVLEMSALLSPGDQLLIWLPDRGLSPEQNRQLRTLFRLLNLHEKESNSRIKLLLKR